AAGEYINGRTAHVRVWAAALSQAELEAEMASATVVRTANLWGDWPLDGDANDISGNGRNLTASGTVAWVDGPDLSEPEATPFEYDFSSYAQDATCLPTGWVATAADWRIYAGHGSEPNEGHVLYPSSGTFGDQWMTYDAAALDVVKQVA